MIRIDEPGYPIWMGREILDQIGALLPPGRHFMVTDENVEAAGWAGRVSARLGPRLAGTYVLPPGEGSKNIRQLGRLLDILLEAGVERTDHVLAVGGGMVGDIAGFAAAILKRGCGFVQVPTTLLAQADAAIGGKTAINTRQGKNLVGAFHRPRAVVIDTATLETLAAREIRAGYAEVVKYGLIGDRVFFAWCEANAAALLAGDAKARLHAVEKSIRAKLAVVAQDERDERGPRALLNFGHSFAHAIEAEAGLPHGEAVALGMVLAFRLSVERGLCAAADSDRVAAHLHATGLPTRLEKMRPAGLVARMAHDKKRQSGEFRLVLVRGIGEAFVDDSVAPAEVEAFLERELNSARFPVR